MLGASLLKVAATYALRRRKSYGSPQRARMAQGQSSEGPLRPLTRERAATRIKRVPRHPYGHRGTTF